MSVEKIVKCVSVIMSSLYEQKAEARFGPGQVFDTCHISPLERSGNLE